MQKDSDLLDSKKQARTSVQPSSVFPVSQINFLSEVMGEYCGLTRTEGGFVVTRPWGRAHARSVALKTGWWRLECRGKYSDGVEVRLSSRSDPLVVIRAANANDSRFFLRSNHQYDVSLLVSPWPGAFSFDTLLLRRLSLREQTGFLTLGAARVLGKDQPLKRAVSVIRRMAAGRSVGVSMVPDSSPPEVSEAWRLPRTSDSLELKEQEGVVCVTARSDELHPSAFRLVGAHFAENSSVAAILADAEEAGSIDARPAWDVELGHWIQHVRPPIFFRSEVWRHGIPAVDQLRSLATKGSSCIGRISLPLARRKGRWFLPVDKPVVPRLSSPPRVSAIIPTKLRIDLLAKCLDGLAQRTSYSNLEVVIVDNGAKSSDLLPLLQGYANKLEISRVEDFGNFNFSRLVNKGASRAKGDVLLLLNDDVEPVEQGWLTRMVSSAVVSDVGVVGARLHYSDGSIQHAGVAMGIGGVCGHLWKGRHPDDGLPDQVLLPSSRRAVTGACLATRKHVFDTHGGFDEVEFPVAYNDIDYCLRLDRAGLRTVFRGDAVLIHHESQSRGPDELTSRRRKAMGVEMARFVNRWGSAIYNDPWSSPAIDPRFEIGTPHPSLFVRRMGE